MSRKFSLRVVVGVILMISAFFAVLIVALPFFTLTHDLGAGVLDTAGTWLDENFGFFSSESRFSRFSLSFLAVYLVLLSVWFFRAYRKPGNYLKILFSIPIFFSLRLLFLQAQRMAFPSYLVRFPILQNQKYLALIFVAEVAFFALASSLLQFRKYIIRRNSRKAALSPRKAGELEQQAVMPAVADAGKADRKKKKLEEAARLEAEAAAEKEKTEAAVSRQETPEKKGLLYTEVPSFNSFHIPEEAPSAGINPGQGEASVVEPISSSVSLGIYDVVRKESHLMEEKHQNQNQDQETQGSISSWKDFQPGNLTKRVAEDEKALRTMLEMEKRVREKTRLREEARKKAEELERQQAAEAEELARRQAAEADRETVSPEEFSRMTENVQEEPAFSVPDIPEVEVETENEVEIPVGDIAPEPEPEVIVPRETVIAPGPVIKEDDENGWKKSEYDDYDLFSGVGGLGHAENAESKKSYLLNRQDLLYLYPPKSLLKTYPKDDSTEHDEQTLQRGRTIVNTLSQFRVECKLVGITRGPTVTLYELTLAPGVKISSVTGLTDNIAMDLAVSQVRLLTPIPGKQAIGVEVPNFKRETIGFEEIIDSLDTKNMVIPVVLGKKITGESVAMDLTSAPHVLIAGATGSGKSVCVNSMICSILYTKSPKEVRMIMVDPKIVELKIYNGIPHLLTPVITDPKKAIKAMQFCLDEMDRRYHVIGSVNVRNIDAYNKKIVSDHLAREKMPYIVVIMDEFADLMAVAGKELETLLHRLSAMARAVGIHLVFATQRPSAEVVTGLIKNNLPTKIAFSVTNQVNSKIILDCSGAEKLLGKGDMLYATSSIRDPVRIQGAFLSDPEVESISDFVKTQGKPDYLDEALFEDEEPESDDDFDEESAFSGDDAIYEKALKIVCDRQSASASYLQRRLSIGYNKAARLIERMEDEGYVGPARGSKPRELLKYPD